MLSILVSSTDQYRGWGSMDDDQLWADFDAGRAALADLLDTLTEEQWDTPSLCDGWRVREVAAHVAMSAPSMPAALSAMVRSGFRFNVMMDRLARAHADRPTDTIVADIRALLGSRRRPPGTDRRDPLLDTLVHTQDIARPLGIDYPMPPDAAVVAAELAWSRSFPFRARQRLDGYRVRATDAAFDRGTGAALELPMGTILLVLTGRIEPASLTRR
jgi:uncharacterized protein (TIGR03083 family)